MQANLSIISHELPRLGAFISARGGTIRDKKPMPTAVIVEKHDPYNEDEQPYNHRKFCQAQFDELMRLKGSKRGLDATQQDALDYYERELKYEVNEA